MNIKKLITTVAFALGAWMSVAAQAQTPYDSFTVTSGSTNYNYSLYYETYNAMTYNETGAIPSLQNSPWWNSQSETTASSYIDSAVGYAQARGKDWGYIQIHI
ncbi:MULTISPECIES: hypothetical protein [Polynucleobacter]|nr:MULTISPECIES: hypothetical protein [Polynucleobacter]MBU3551697.1 hypothetical protein [Polynucleobacter sp. MWH-Post4-6-1]MBU3611072.1 hypothetical protein [Polynucleobacter wuianus]